MLFVIHWDLVMRIAVALFTVVFICFIDGGLIASDYLLQFEEVTGDKVVTSLETNVSLGQPFYIRSVESGFQTVLHGDITKNSNGGFVVSYVYDGAELRDDPTPRTRFSGSLTLQRNARSFLEPSEKSPNPHCKYGFTIRPFTPVIGFRDTSSSVTVKLVDGEGLAVENATLGFYGRFADGERRCLIGPIASGPDGVVQVSEGREDLPMLTVVAEHKGRKIVGVANLNRNSALKPYELKLTSKLRQGKFPNSKAGSRGQFASNPLSGNVNVTGLGELSLPRGQWDLEHVLISDGPKVWPPDCFVLKKLGPEFERVTILRYWGRTNPSYLQDAVGDSIWNGIPVFIQESPPKGDATATMIRRPGKSTDAVGKQIEISYIYSSEKEEPWMSHAVLTATDSCVFVCIHSSCHVLSPETISDVFDRSTFLSQAPATRNDLEQPQPPASVKLTTE